VALDLSSCADSVATFDFAAAGLDTPLAYDSYLARP